MQRIDENTYIDDTLVTCAEYQLFIDEMCEWKGYDQPDNRKYYQPDHWTSYQFPKGQARKPILGVRGSDAIAFCEWFTRRESSEWIFRLPSEQEGATYRLTSSFQKSLGYWSNGSNNQFNFIWIGSVPENPRALDRALGRADALDRALDRLNLDFDRALARAHALDLDIYRALDYPELHFYLDRAHTLYRALDRLELDRFELDFDRALARARAIDRDLDLTLDIYIDLYTLQERIAGRSPAFEGIRLVKERIR